MKTASRTSEKINVENPELHFNFKWNPTSDSARLKAWEEENAEYATWNLIDEGQITATC